MDFIIHAAGSLGNVPDLGQHAYRLRFSVVTWPRPTPTTLKRGLRQSLEQMEQTVRLQGFHLTSEASVRFETKRVCIEPMTLQYYRAPSAREMLPQIREGAHYRAPMGETLARAMPLLEESESWEYIFSALFVHQALIADVPHPHEEREVMCSR